MHCRGGPEWPPPQQAEYNKPAGQLLRRTHYFRTQQKNCLGTRPRQFKRCEQYFHLPECPSPVFRYKKTVKQAKSYSPAKQIAVPSALEGLTSGFGMGPGGPPPLFSPASTALSKLVKRSFARFTLLTTRLDTFVSAEVSHLLSPRPRTKRIINRLRPRRFSTG